MLKDRRKPWQKTANIKWSRCGHMLAETAAALAKDRWAPKYSQRSFDLAYADAWAKAYGKHRSEFHSVVSHSTGIADPRERAVPMAIAA